MSGTKRKEQKEKTKEHLLEVAIQEFSNRGILAVTTLDIAKSAEVSHGTVFLHFPTRDALIIEVIDQFAAVISEKFNRVVEQRHGVRDILAAHLEVIREYEGLYAHLVIESPLLPSRIRSTLFFIQSGICHFLEIAATREMNQHLIRLMPIHLLFNTWLGLLHYYLANRDLFAPEKSVVAVCGQEILDHFIYTLRA
jgi:AcrR family transcriptional regulator